MHGESIDGSLETRHTTRSELQGGRGIYHMFCRKYNEPLFLEKQGNIRRSVRGDTGNKISDIAKFLVQYSEYFTQFCLGLNIFLGIASENMSTLDKR